MARYAHARRAAVLWAAGLGILSAQSALASPNTWMGFSPDWDTPPNWSLGHEPALADDAIFPAFVPAGLGITLTPGELAKSLAFFSSYSLMGGSLTLGTSATISVDPGFAASLSTTLVNTGTTYTKLGGGTLNLG